MPHMFTRYLATALAILTTAAGVAVGGPSAVASAVTASPPHLSYVPAPGWWGTNGRVTDIVPLGNRVYLSGGFDYIGPQTGHGVAVNATTGARMAGPAPMIDGTVLAAIPDGAGGWYVGGSFQHVDGVHRSNVARITSTGTLAPWHPRVDGTVTSLALVGSEVVIGGSFTSAGAPPVPSPDLAAVDAVHGQAVAGFHGETSSAAVDLAVSNGKLYLAGGFATVDGQPHPYVARIDPLTGALDPSFTVRTDGSVRAIAVSADGSTVYLGGDFTHATSGSTPVPRAHLAAYGTGSGALLPWAPAVDASVRALAVDGVDGDVFAGGDFATAGGLARARLAAIGPSGTVEPFNADLSGCNTKHVIDHAHSDPPCTSQVDALGVSDGVLYVGGRFELAGVAGRHDAAAFSTTDGSLAPWNPVASDAPLTLAPSGINVFLGGDLTSVGGLVRPGVAALDLATGAGVPAFDATPDNEVLDIQPTPDGRGLYLAGHFDTIDGHGRGRLAEVSAADGSLVTDFRVRANNDVVSLAYAGGSLYATGQFTKVDGVTRDHAVKLDPASGAVDPSWVADTSGPKGKLHAGGMVDSMVASPDGTKIYLAGPFTSLNGAAVPDGISVVNGSTGALLSNLGGVNNCPHSKNFGVLGPFIVRLALSADGTRLYGGDVCPDNIYQWDAVHLATPANPTGLNWTSWCNGGLQGALEVDGDFYFGSHGGSRGNGGVCWAAPDNHQDVVQSRYAVFDAATGTLLPDHPQFDSPMGVWAYAAIPQGLLVGGDFTFAGQRSQVHQGLALFPGTP